MGRSPLSICPSLSFRVRTASRDTGRPPETKQAQDSPGAKKPGTRWEPRAGKESGLVINYSVFEPSPLLAGCFVHPLLFRAVSSQQPPRRLLPLLHVPLHVLALVLLLGLAPGLL